MQGTGALRRTRRVPSLTSQVGKSHEEKQFEFRQAEMRCARLPGMV